METRAGKRTRSEEEEEEEEEEGGKCCIKTTLDNDKETHGCRREREAGERIGSQPKRGEDLKRWRRRVEVKEKKGEEEQEEN
ncbi:hypothetical protein RF55_16 [Lasius niger]|uniref:Uncharacterized protein n=1 Tax=Lasius niger TaxID=67767 RepID=A0A0J7LBE3_LASNI|nr:hypothetical protein RF55_16 [Lasius niger]